MRIRVTTLIFGCALLLQFCATPMSPTGGEPDRSGPKLVETYPVNETVNFTEVEIRFRFEDYVDRNSFRTAFSIEPDMNIGYDISWRKKTATVRFRNQLPDSTTVVFRLSPDLRDTRSNPITSALSLAISTGPDIDDGTISIKVKPFTPDINTDNVSVFLYREPVDFDAPARYVGYPDTAGTVAFKYLSEGAYRAFVINDINRNRRWEPTREFAQPIKERQITLEDGVPLELQTVWYALRDTSKPELQGVGLLSSQRLRLRFNKPIRYRPSLTINISEQSTGETIRAGFLFNDPQDENVSYFHADRPLAESDSFKVDLGVLRDRSGNRVLPHDEYFEGSDVADTLFVQYDAHLTDKGVRNIEPLIMAYSGAIPQGIILDSLKFYANRGLALDKIRVETRYNLLYVYPATQWQASETYELSIWDPMNNRHRGVPLTFLRDADFGDISVTIMDSTFTDQPMHLLLYNDRKQLIESTSFQNETTLKSIIGSNYHLVIFNDPDENGIWNSGQVRPFRAPDAVFVNPRFPVRAGMTAEVEVEFPN